MSWSLSPNVSLRNDRVPDDDADRQQRTADEILRRLGTQPEYGRAKRDSGSAANGGDKQLAPRVSRVLRHGVTVIPRIPAQGAAKGGQGFTFLRLHHPGADLSLGNQLDDDREPWQRRPLTRSAARGLAIVRVLT